MQAWHYFEILVSNGLEEFHLELTKLQYDSIMHSSFIQDALISLSFMFLYQYLSSLSYVS
jgi:hypothetical protein